MKKTTRLILILAFTLGLSISLITFTQPSWALMFLERRSPNVIYSVDTGDSVIALTIDDGPDPLTTPTILSTLRKHDAHATFFLISTNIKGNEALVQRIIDEGHEIGNHFTTERPSILYSKTEFESKLLEAHKTLSNYSRVRWFRPGSGLYNSAMLSILEKHDYQCVLGSVYPFDAQVPSSQFASRYVLWRVKPGAIILLHDNDDRGERTVETLNIILPELNHQGFRVTTVSELVESAESEY